MAYRLHKQRHVRYIVVFDFGGYASCEGDCMCTCRRGQRTLHSGTLDVSLLWVSNAVFEVVAISGDSHLGGEDFTHNLVNFLASQVMIKRKQKPTDLADLQQLRNAAETIKIALSNAETARVTLSLFGGDEVELDVTRAEFEEVNDVLFARYRCLHLPLHATPGC